LKSATVSILLLLSPLCLFSQIPVDSSAVRSDSLFLKVVIPEQDTTTAGSRHRIAASTHPSARAFINDREVRVYPSGAFVGLVDVPVGTTPLRLTVKSPAGDSLWRDFIFQRPDPPRTSSRDTLQIDSLYMEPSEDIWLIEGDVLEVRFKGSPGYEATFSIEGIASGMPMTELPPREAYGFEGMYVGRYKVKPGDNVRDVPVEFRLKKSFWSREHAESRGKVSLIPAELPRVAEVTGRAPFLNAGLGRDRLGGAKLGYIDRGIRLRVTGKRGDQYRVQLSKDMIAWLPQDFVKFLPPQTPLPSSLTGSVSITGSDSEDVVLLSLNQRLPYVADLQVDPPALLVDVFGATSNTNWITQEPSATGIQNVSWDQVSQDRYRLTIALAYQQHWGYDIGYNNGSGLRIRIRRPPQIASADSVLKGMIIAVDAGHGGDNRGAIGSTGVEEHFLNYVMSKHLEQVLAAKGARVVLTRPDTINVPMLDRAALAASSRARLLVSIHCNSIGYTSDPEQVKGMGTFYRYVAFQPLANAVFNRLLETGLTPWGVTGSFNFSLNAPTQMPNVLVETAFMSNPEDEMLLLDDAFRRRVAEKIAQGMEDFVRSYAVLPQ
jgi:N-acetylmuramoyl-L-alanine amidase